jgi:16S rRNA (guanine1516-N2)-methyltransferase
VPEVVYLDPMFPVRRKTALPGRELQVLARLVGHGEMAEGEALLRAALEAGARRVVVKRGDDGAVLSAPGVGGPDVQFSGRTVRFDVYLWSGSR